MVSSPTLTFHFETAILQYQPLVFAYAKKFTGFIEFEEAVSTAQEALVVAASEFRRQGSAEKGRQFGPYAKRIVYNALCALYRQKKERLVECSVDYQAIEHSTSEDTFNEQHYFKLRWLADPQTTVGTLTAPDCFTQFEFLTLFNAFYKTLDQTEKFLVYKRLKGASQEDCAVMMDMSQSTISRMLKELYIKYKEFARGQ